MRVRYFFALPLTALLLLAQCKSPSKSTPDLPAVEGLLTGQVIDMGELFDEVAEADLVAFLDSIESITNLDLVACTVGDPGEGGLESFALSMTRRISPGVGGMNNGAIIYLSAVTREVKVEANHGLEWIISDTIAGMVIESMRERLAAGDYSAALRGGFRSIQTYADTIEWKLSHLTWSAGLEDSLEKGDILRIEATGFARPYQEGVPESHQFHPNYYINLQPHGSTVQFPLYFSGYMRDLVDRIVYGEGTPEITVLVLATSPLKVGLLGMRLL